MGTVSSRGPLFTILAFLVAPLVAALCLAVISPLDGHAINTDIEFIFGLGALFYVYALVLSSVLSVPIYLLLRKLRLIQWWSTMLAGGVIGACLLVLLNAQALITDLPLVVAWAFIGALSAFVFWLIWRVGHHVPEEGH